MEPKGTTTKYTLLYPDGFYCYKGECGSSKHRTPNLADATFYDDPESVRFWVDREGGRIVKVRIQYFVVPETPDIKPESDPEWEPPYLDASGHADGDPL